MPNEMTIDNAPTNYLYTMMGTINSDSVAKVMNYINGLKNVHTITLSIGSSGGSFIDALTLYNYLKASPYKIITHNISEVSSAAIIIYLAGEIRTCEEMAKFMIHPITYDCDGTLSYYKLRELTIGLETDINTYTNIVNRETSNLNSSVDVKHYLKYESLIFNKDDAFKYNVVTSK